MSGGAGIGFALALTVFAAPNNAQLLLCASVGCADCHAGCVELCEPQKALIRTLAAGRHFGRFARICHIEHLPLDRRSAVVADSCLAQRVIGNGNAGKFAFLVVLTFTVIGLALLASRWLTILPLGQAIPVSLGLPVRSARILTILLAAIASAAASLLVGPLSFVGLMAPHMTRRMGFDQAQSHVVASAVLGALLMVIADLGSRNATFL